MSSSWKIELLAPGGDVDSIKAAIIAGADAIYCGLDRFNARNRAHNISYDDLNGILVLAHKSNCQIFITLNIIIIESEIPALLNLLNKLVNSSVDGIIVQDLGLFYLLSKHFKRFVIHASTQLTTHNTGQIHFLHKLGARRINLSRELNFSEIEKLSKTAHQHDMLTEVFVHGSYCISFSGLCYMSSLINGNSGNRGRCSQPCRDEYLTTSQGIRFPLNLKDNSAFCDLRELADAGVDSIKIEGRIKKFHYVYTVVSAWRKQLDNFFKGAPVSEDKSVLYSVFNRDFSDGFLHASINKDMFIDNPRDHSAVHLASKACGEKEPRLEEAKKRIYDLRTDIITTIGNKIDQLPIDKVPLRIEVSGETGFPLQLSIKTPQTAFIVCSTLMLSNTIKNPLSCEEIEKRLAPVNETEFFIQQIRCKDFRKNLFLPFKELTALKNRLLYVLNGSRETIPAVDLARPKKRNEESIRPTLSVLINSTKDLPLVHNHSSDFYFQLPGILQPRLAEIISLFREHKSLTPWFPALLLGVEYAAAVSFLEQSQPQYIVTDNTGIAYEAWKRGISWIAGPYFNTVNSYSMSCIQEQFNCAGAFISNELKRSQIKQIKKPAHFKLYYSIYHPIMLMTSRVCLFHQVTGCEKHTVDGSCIYKCERESSITNLKEKTFLIKKTKGNYHTIYNARNLLNTDIVTDIPGAFTSFFIDLREIQGKTDVMISKGKTIELFKKFIGGDSSASTELHNNITPSTNAQYLKGI